MVVTRGHSSGRDRMEEGEERSNYCGSKGSLKGSLNVVHDIDVVHDRPGRVKGMHQMHFSLFFPPAAQTFYDFHISI